ncbi:hypothetical protein PROFUN_03591 [Planoprotostelium fungivorum]|uniref:Uncharacterized protein n=1 Tax=Planoprotostelium fungivorum TaxID=1890364 RepID=A0A2P6MSI9_9EUKA|nr:hypothetical protein PROFUN_03591 [Planoprotostelium fungivorum]
MTRDFVTAHFGRVMRYAKVDTVSHRIPQLVYRFEFDEGHWDHGMPRLATDAQWYNRDVTLPSIIGPDGKEHSGTHVRSFYTMIQFTTCTRSWRICYDFEQEAKHVLDLLSGPGWYDGSIYSICLRRTTEFENFRRRLKSSERAMQTPFGKRNEQTFDH